MEKTTHQLGMKKVLGSKHDADERNSIYGGKSGVEQHDFLDDRKMENLSPKTGFQFCSNAFISKFKSRSSPTKNLPSSDEESKFSLLESVNTESLYRFRKDVCFKFVLRKIRWYYKKEYANTLSLLLKDGVLRKNDALELKVLKYCELKGYCNISRELPFYIAAFIFPKETEGVLRQMKRQDHYCKEKLSKVLQIVELLKRVVKNYSEARLQKVLRISEIRFLFRTFIQQFKRGRIHISGLVNDNAEEDAKYVNEVVAIFTHFVTNNK